MSDCGCRIVREERSTAYDLLHIEFCPLHAAAEKLREVLQSALDWDAEYRAINNLGKQGPHWADWAQKDLKMFGHFAAAKGTP